jgi:hypothetical protein
MRVNFVVAGAQKSGTTSLYHYLSQHPDIQMSKIKETHFFDDDDFFKSKPINYSAYHQYFLPAQNKKLLGEATPIYMYWTECAKRMYEYNPDLKIILI